jgi:hypothetical protein
MTSMIYATTILLFSIEGRSLFLGCGFQSLDIFVGVIIK